MTMLRDIALVENGRIDSTDERVGVLASEIPTGFPLPAFLLNDIDAGAPARLYALKILTLPSAGTLFLDKAGAGTFTGAPVGTYAGTQRIEKFDPGVGLVSSVETTYSLTVGAIQPPAPTVSGVTLTPENAVIDGPTQQYSWSVAGTNSPPQTVDLSATLGTIDAAGLLTRPAKTNAPQFGTVTASSTLDPDVLATVTFTVPAEAVVDQPIDVRTVSLQLGDENGPAANLRNLSVSFHAANGPGSTQLALYQSETESTDANARISFTFGAELMAAGDIGLISILHEDGHNFLGRVAVS